MRRASTPDKKKTPNFFEVSMCCRTFLTLPDSDLVVPEQLVSKRSLILEGSAP